MNFIDFSRMKFSHIQIFLAVAEFGSVTLAAEKLHLTQPFVSKTIRQLEEDLGLYLFVRGKKFQITPAGRILYQEWNTIIHQFESSISNAHLIQEGHTEKLTIGIGQLGRNAKEDILLENMKKTRQQLPDLDIYAEYNTMSLLVKSLLKNELDLIIVSRHILPEIEDLKIHWQVLLPSHLAIYMHVNNTLGSLKNLKFEHLRQEKFIVFSPEVDHNYLRLLQKLSFQAGFHPKISCYVKNESSFLINLELNNGIVLADSISNLANKQIRQFNLPERNDLIAMWKPESMRPCIRTFLDLFPDPV